MTRPALQSTPPPDGRVAPAAGLPPPEDRPADPPAGDPYDIEALRLDQDFASATGVKKLVLTVPVRKPDKTWWVRTHPDPGYRLATGLLDLREDRESYLVARPLWAALGGEPAFTPHVLVLAVNRQNVPFLWPLRLPGDDGRSSDWHRSAIEAAATAEGAWTRVYADMSLGAYRVEVSTLQAPPAWPELTMNELIRVAFKETLIDRLDHPALRRLRGEV
jgi:hypothetical protein